MIWGKSAACTVFAIVLGTSTAQLSESQPVQTDAETGLIDGTVVYEDGRPTKGATVYAVPLGRPMGAVIPQGDTDEAGYFRINIPSSWFGRFAVAAKKEDEDYPNMSMQFYSDGKFETVTLTSSGRVATVSIRLGPKAGVLLGAVADAVTGAPLMPCVELIRASEPNNFLSGSGLVKSSYRLLIPSDTDVLVRIWLDGYEPWYYPGTTDKSTAQAVWLRPGEDKVVDIALRPDVGVNTGCPKAVGAHPDASSFERMANETFAQLGIPVN